MPNYRRLDTGESVGENNPNRGIWYSAGICGYWTDDWDKIKLNELRIPSCPSCGMVGFQTTAKSWFAGAKIFEEEGNTGYLHFLTTNKEKCDTSKSFLDRYRQYLEDHGEVTGT
jgi:hypothetical protein